MSRATGTSETKLGQWDEVYTYFKSVKLKKYRVIYSIEKEICWNVFSSEFSEHVKTHAGGQKTEPRRA